MISIAVPLTEKWEVKSIINYRMGPKNDHIIIAEEIIISKIYGVRGQHIKYLPYAFTEHDGQIIAILEYLNQYEKAKQESCCRPAFLIPEF